jgi:hypothetical protein
MKLTRAQAAIVADDKVWFVEMGEDVPRFVTAYPIRERKP